MEENKNLEFKGTKNWRLGETDGSYKYLSGDWWDRFARVVVRLDGKKNNYPEGSANAKLIAAAPELLEALKPFIDYPMEDLKAWISADRPVTITVHGKMFKDALNAVNKALK